MAGNKQKISNVLKVVLELANYDQIIDELVPLKSPVLRHHVI